MKKTTYLLAIFIAFQTIAFAQYTLIPDSNFEQALITFGYDSEGTLDGQILTADATAATGLLGLAGQGISDLTGIEAFVNIDGLNVNYNTLNVPVDLSFNTLLISARFEGCATLPSLNVSGLTSLFQLDIFGTAISTIDLSTNTGLTELIARNSQLTDLDLSNNPNIVVVNARNCNLMSLDMRNGNNANVTSFNSDFNSNLTCIFVDDSSEPNLATWTVDGGSTFVETDPECATLSREVQTISQFNVYPNPATSQVTIESTVSNGQIEIFNITGKRVLSKTISLGENSLNVSSLVSGVYLARISSNGNIETKKLIIN